MYNPDILCKTFTMFKQKNQIFGVFLQTVQKKYVGKTFSCKHHHKNVLFFVNHLHLFNPQKHDSRQSFETVELINGTLKSYTTKI